MGIILYDAIFFFLHWGMHEIPLLRYWHRRHHQCTPLVEARDVLRHGLVDGALQVLVNILVQRHTPWGAVKTRLARGLHNIVVIWMLTESHTASPYPNIWRKYFVGVREHCLHHSPPRDGKKCVDTEKRVRYQQFFGYLDGMRFALGTWQAQIYKMDRNKIKSL